MGNANSDIAGSYLRTADEKGDKEGTAAEETEHPGLFRGPCRRLLGKA